MKDKSCNLNTIPVNNLKSIYETISPCLTNIINRRLITGVSATVVEVLALWPVEHASHARDLGSNPV